MGSCTIRRLRYATNHHPHPSRMGSIFPVTSSIACSPGARPSDGPGRSRSIASSAELTTLPKPQNIGAPQDFAKEDAQSIPIFNALRAVEKLLSVAIARRTWNSPFGRREARHLRVASQRAGTWCQVLIYGSSSDIARSSVKQRLNR